MILRYDKIWLHYLKDIDIKCYKWPWDDDYWEEALKVNTIKVWLEKDKKVPHGFVAYRFVDVQDLIKTNVRETIVLIRKLAVHPSWRGEGIGTQLLENMEAGAKIQDVNHLAIIIHEENEKGRTWLMRRNFKVVKLHRNIFPDDRDGYSFSKELE